MTYLRTQILEMSRQNQQPDDLSPWLSKKLDRFIEDDTFLDEKDIGGLGDAIVAKIRDYKIQTGVSTAVLGMSGGVDSALTAALLQQAGWNVIGITMPIHQNSEETELGIHACDVLGIEHRQIDLSELYNVTIIQQSKLDINILEYHGLEKKDRIRRGNIRARLRMITLYNLAASVGGLVASTDNYSELAVGFWTLHGDVGDLSPIQSMTKSWEVPMMAKMFGVPESIWRAKPTDGLGVDDGDEAQFGFSYLELDIMLLAIGDIIDNGFFHDRMISKGGVNRRRVIEELNIITEDTVVDSRAEMVFNRLMDRMSSTWFKRMNPVNIKHPVDSGRFRRLDSIDVDLFQPNVVKE